MGSTVSYLMTLTRPESTRISSNKRSHKLKRRHTTILCYKKTSKISPKRSRSSNSSKQNNISNPNRVKRLESFEVQIESIYPRKNSSEIKYRADGTSIYASRTDGGSIRIQTQPEGLFDWSSYILSQGIYAKDIYTKDVYMKEPSTRVQYVHDIYDNDTSCDCSRSSSFHSIGSQVTHVCILYSCQEPSYPQQGPLTVDFIDCCFVSCSTSPRNWLPTKRPIPLLM